MEWGQVKQAGFTEALRAVAKNACLRVSEEHRTLKGQFLRRCLKDQKGNLIVVGGWGDESESIVV